MKTKPRWLHRIYDMKQLKELVKDMKGSTLVLIGHCHAGGKDSPVKHMTFAEVDGDDKTPVRDVVINEGKSLYPACFEGGENENKTKI